MSIDVEVAVIGGGPAGLSAARTAARAGMAVALVEPEGVGGRAARSTTLPMRLLTQAADAQRTDWPELTREIAARARKQSERSALSLDDTGIELVRSRARFASPTSLALEDGRTLTFERAVIAAGSAPARLPGASPDGVRLLAPDDVGALEALPESAMVIGGGSAGAELADVLSRLGVKVTWLMDELGILPSFDRELADVLGDVLMDRGVKLVHGKNVVEIATTAASVVAKLDGGYTYAAPLTIVAIGNQPRAGELGLEAAGLSADARGAIGVDDRARTAVPHVFAAGDVTGVTHDVAGAEAMGRVAGREAAGIEGAPFVVEHVPRVVFARPEVAQVGLTPDAAAGREILIHTLRLEETLGGLLRRIGEGANDKGVLRLVCRSDDGRVLGATALGPGAADAVSAVALAIALGATDADLASGAVAIPSTLDALVRAVR